MLVNIDTNTIFKFYHYFFFQAPPPPPPPSHSASATSDLSLNLRPGSKTTSAPSSPAKSRESLLQRVQSLTGQAKEQGASILGAAVSSATRVTSTVSNPYGWSALATVIVGFSSESRVWVSHLLAVFDYCLDALLLDDVRIISFLLKLGESVFPFSSEIISGYNDI